MVRFPLLVVTLVCASAPFAAAQTGTLKSDLLADWLAMKDTMMRISEAMPEEKYSYRSTPAQRSFGEQILHVADGNRIGMGLLGTNVTPPVIDMKATRKADIVKSLADSYDFGAAVVRNQSLCGSHPGRSRRRGVDCDLPQHRDGIHFRQIDGA